MTKQVLFSTCLMKNRERARPEAVSQGEGRYVRTAEPGAESKGERDSAQDANTCNAAGQAI